MTFTPCAEVRARMMEGERLLVTHPDPTRKDPDPILILERGGKVSNATFRAIQPQLIPFDRGLIHNTPQSYIMKRVHHA